MLSSIRTRLQALGQFKLISGAAQFVAASNSAPAADPAVFVFEMAESGSPSSTYSRVSQRVSVVVATVIVTKNMADVHGQAAVDALTPLRLSVRNALLGYAPPECDPLQFDSGRLLAFQNGYVWWQDTWRTATDFTSTL